MSHQPRDTSALFTAQPQVVAHRGFSGISPENTLAAFTAASDAGHWIELDVTLCKTGEIIVIHDDTVDRTTNGTGEVADLTWAELQMLDAGSWFGAEFAGEPVPSLEQVFAAVPKSMFILVELKTDDDKASLPKAVAAAIQRAGRDEQVMVISFDPFMLEQLRLAAPALLRGQLVGDYIDSDLVWYKKSGRQNLVMTDRVQQDAVLWQHDILTSSIVQAMTELGYPVFAWTVNRPADIQRMKELGIQGVISNHPDRIR